MVLLAPNKTQVQPQYEITEADKARQKLIAAAWKAYNGELDPPLQKMPGQPDDNVLSNRCQAVVDRGVDFLFGKELEVSLEESAPDEAQKLLDTVWGRKETRIPLLQKLAMNGAIAGQAFLRIVPMPNDKTTRLIAVDPATVFVQTAPQDCETVLLYCIEYSTTQKIDNKPAEVFYREEIARIDPDNDGDDGNPLADVDASWSVQHWSRIGDRGPWTPAGEPIPWDYPFPPIFACQNLPMPNSFWGKPDITTDLIGLNYALNLVQSNVNRVQKLYGQPIIYATGTGESVIDIKPGRIIGLPLTESKIVAVPLPSDVANALSFAGNLRSDIDELSGIPGVAMGRIDTPARGMSGIAIELLFMPLLKKTDKKQCSYGELIIDVSKALLIMSRMSDQIEMTLAWQSPLPSDDLPTVQAALMKQQVGISNSTLQRELGYDPDEELALSQTEDAQTITNFSRGRGMPPTDPTQQQQPGQAPGQQFGQPPVNGGQQA
jgi:hypothetical protein